MTGQRNLQNGNVNLAMDKMKIEEILNEEARKLVGYLMPILESMNATTEQRQSFKKIIYSYKNNITEMLINEMSNEKSNNKS